MTHHYDATGLVCPLPVLKARKILLSLPAGALLRITVTDTHAPKDFELFCRESGHGFRGAVEKDGAVEITLQCRAA